MITIAGDSYCFHSGEKGWQYHLGKLLDKPVQIFSKSGASWWSVRKMLIEAKNNNKLSDTEIVVFCHTEGIRLPNRNGIPIGTYTVEKKGYISEELAIIGKGYYKYLYDPLFAQWTYQCWIDECTKIFPDNAFIIHLHSFSYSLTHLKISNGVNVSPPLFGVSSAEFKSDEEHFKFLDLNSGDPRFNHMNTNNNRILAEELSNIIINKLSGNYEISTNRWDVQNSDLIRNHSKHINDDTHLRFNGK